MRKKISIFVVLALVVIAGIVFQRRNSIPITKTNAPAENIAPSPITKPSSPDIPTPPLHQEPMAAIELQWKKEFQKIQEEEARLRAQNKIAELSKFESLGYTCEIIQPENLIIKNKKSWDALLGRMGIQMSTTLFPNIDFNKTMIAAVFTGEQSFTEKLLLIDSQEFQKSAQGKKLVITLRKTFAPKGSTISTIMVQPYHLKIFPTYANDIEFQEALQQ